MKIDIQSIHFDADTKLLDFIQKKYDKLGDYFDRITHIDVILKLDKAEDASNKIVEAKLSIPGNILFAKLQCATFEEAIDLSVDSLSKQLKKYKEKRRIPDHNHIHKLSSPDSPLE